MSSIDTHTHEHGHFHLGAVAGFRVFIVAGIITASLLRMFATAYLPNWTDQLVITLAIGAIVVALVKGLELAQH
jgi:hypothetical protein